MESFIKPFCLVRIQLWTEGPKALCYPLKCYSNAT